MKQSLLNILSLLSLLFFLYGNCYAIEPLNDSALDEFTAKEGITVILEDFKVTHHTEQLSIGGDDGLGIPAAPDGAWFVFESTRDMELDLNSAAFDIDVFTSNGSPYMVDGKEVVPADTTAALINFGEAYFHLNMTDAVLTLKFANNPQGNTGDGITQFSDTVCNFALDGSTVTFRSEDAKMFIYAH